jgi:hypothetical protein
VIGTLTLQEVARQLAEVGVDKRKEPFAGLLVAITPPD